VATERTTAVCRLCGFTLPGAPPGVDTCQAWADAMQRAKGDMLRDEDLLDAELFAMCCKRAAQDPRAREP
jgi:hypothetical protein